jgi:ABC-type uncharacterized transport system fused permease/ATPase subunit
MVGGRKLIESESALQFFRRIRTRPLTIAVPLWPTPSTSSTSSSTVGALSGGEGMDSISVMPGHALEICGRSGSGKTEFLYQG